MWYQESYVSAQSQQLGIYALLGRLMRNLTASQTSINVLAPVSASPVVRRCLPLFQERLIHCIIHWAQRQQTILRPFFRRVITSGQRALLLVSEPSSYWGERAQVFRALLGRFKELHFWADVPTPWPDVEMLRCQPRPRDLQCSNTWWKSERWCSGCKVMREAFHEIPPL